MRTMFYTTLALTMSVQAAAQREATASPERSGWTWTHGNGSLDVSRCATSQQGGEAILSATIITGAGMGAGPNVKRSAGGAGDMPDGDHAAVDFSWGQSNSGSMAGQSGSGHADASSSQIVPTVTAHAIKTKGARSNDRTAGQACDAPPAGQRLLLPAVQRRDAKPVATCDASGDPARPTFTIQIPLSAFGPNAKTGHVSLNKREASAPSLSERPAATAGTATDDSDTSVIATCTSAKGIATYDLAVGKKV